MMLPSNGALHFVLLGASAGTLIQLAMPSLCSWAVLKQKQQSACAAPCENCQAIARPLLQKEVKLVEVFGQQHAIPKCQLESVEDNIITKVDASSFTLQQSILTCQHKVAVVRHHGQFCMKV